jgi:predicted metal-binding membrane protein
MTEVTAYHAPAARTGRAMALAAVLGLAAACWATAAWLMDGMDMGIATRPGAFGFFAAAWVTMMAAMMLPGAAPAVARRAGAGGTVRAALPFTACYLGVWALAGLAAYALDRPHGPLAAGVVVIAAGGYELTAVKRHFRRRCRAAAGSGPDSGPDSGPSSGLGYGLCCLGSGIGLMAVLVALGVMSLVWMSAVAVIGGGQKLLAPKAVIDVPLALALIGLGLVIVIAPAQVPGLMPPSM